MSDNRFIIKNGAVVESTLSGTTVFEIEGVDRSLLSVTDSTTGEIFNIPNVTGGTALNVSAEGNILVGNNITASQFIKSGGTSAQFLKADGSSDSNIYSQTGHTHSSLQSSIYNTADLNTLNFTGGFSAKSALSTSPNIFPTVNNANAVLTVDMYEGGAAEAYQLGFSSSGNFYSRYSNSAWHKVWSELNFNPANYLPLAGGTLVGDTYIGSADNTSWLPLRFRRSGVTGFIGIGGTALQLGLDNGYLDISSTNLTFVENGTTSRTVLHTGNYSTYAAPASHNQAWSTITDRPTTLSGYGITDAAPATHYHDTRYQQNISGIGITNCDSIGGLSVIANYQWTNSPSTTIGLLYTNATYAPNWFTQDFHSIGENRRFFRNYNGSNAAFTSWYEFWHTGNFNPGNYLTTTAAASTYLGISAKAVDSDKLDGNDSTYFAAASSLSNYSLTSHNHSGVYEPAFAKNTAFNKNFGTSAGTVAEGNDSRIVNGQTAFGWGNHANAGYASASSLSNYSLTSHTHSYITSTRYDSGDPKPNQLTVGLSFQFSLPDGGWYNAINMRSYDDANYLATQIVSSANNPGLDTGYSYSLKYREGRNATWLGWKTIIDSSNYSSYALPLSGGTLSGDLITRSFWSGQDGTGIYFEANGTYAVNGMRFQHPKSGGGYNQLLINGTNNQLLYNGSQLLSTANFSSYAATSGHNHNGTYAPLAGSTSQNFSVNRLTTNEDIYINGSNLYFENNTNKTIKMKTATAWWYDLKTINNDFSITDADNYEFIKLFYNGGAKYTKIGNVSITGGAINMSGPLTIASGGSAASDSTPTALSYGRLQAFGDLHINGNTDVSGTEYVIITSGYATANSTTANGLAIGQATLTWKNNNIIHAGNYSSYALPLAGGTMSNTNLVTNLNAEYIGGWALNKIKEWGSQRNFPIGTLIATDIWYGNSEGESFYIEIKGNTYSRLGSVFTQAQGYIYSNTIINYSVTHLGVNPISGVIAMNIAGYLHFWFPNQGYWEGYNIRVTGYGHENRVTAVTNSSKPSGTKEVNLSGSNYTSYHSANLTQYLGVNILPVWGGSTLLNSNITNTSEGIIVNSGGGTAFIGGHDIHHGFLIRKDGTNILAYYEYGGTLSSGQGHLFYTGGLRDAQTLKLQIADNGVYIANNLGLGTVTPDLRLSVSGDAHISNILYMGGTAGSYSSWGSRTLVNAGNYSVGAKSFHFDNYGYGTTWAVDFNENGNVGIGYTGRSEKLAVNGSGYFASLLTIQPTFGGYAEGLRIGAYGGWSNVQFKVNTANQTGTVSGQWLIGVNPADTWCIVKGGSESAVAIPTNGLSIPYDLSNIRFNANVMYHAGNANRSDTAWTASTLTATTSMTSPAYYHSSDMRLKNVIRPLENVLNTIRNFSTFLYTEKRRPELGLQLGMSAQEFNTYFPTVVGRDGEDFLMLQYPRISVIAIKAVQEIDIIQQQHEKEVADLKANIEQLELRLRKLEEKLFGSGI